MHAIVRFSSTARFTGDTLTRTRIDLVQILRQRFFSGLHLGILKSGSRLPSIRELEAEFRVDRRAVLTAYRDLERDGVVELRQRSGIFVNSNALGLPGGSPPAGWVVEMFARGLEMGIAAPKLPAALAEQISTCRLRALCVECNSDQLSSLADELESDYGFETTRANVDELLLETSASPGLEQVDLVVTTQFYAGEVQEIATRAGRPWIAVTLRTDIYAEIARLLTSTEVYFIVYDPIYAMKLGRIFAPVPGAHNFHPLVIGRDDVDSVPATAPAYITQEARARLKNEELLKRVMPEERTFSLDSARELLKIVVEANMAALHKPQS